MTAIQLAEKGKLPDWLVRIGIQWRLRKTLANVMGITESDEKFKRQKWIEELNRSPIALVPEKANEQHYELPPQFFTEVLGSHLKYSSGYWPEGRETMDEAEAKMLRLTCERADLQDGQDILELGCGWGSLTLWMAEHYPNSTIHAVSNSKDQAEFIRTRAAERDLRNVTVQTADMNEFSTEENYDRIVSVEMFEHMRNYKELMKRIHGWLKPGGKLFVHIFTHEKYAYPYVDNGPDDWMARYFFTGGQMPSHDLLPEFRGGLEHEGSWKVNGLHYAKTSKAWLDRMDEKRDSIMNILERTYGKEHANLWFHRWRLFFMACEELFRFRGGKEWFVSHYRFAKAA